MKAAGSANDVTEGAFVDRNSQEQAFRHDARSGSQSLVFHSMSSLVVSSFRRSAYRSTVAGSCGRTTTIQSNPEGQLWRWYRKASRNRRLIRFRRTALPTAREMASPILAQRSGQFDNPRSGSVRQCHTFLAHIGCSRLAAWILRSRHIGQHCRDDPVASVFLSQHDLRSNFVCYGK